MLVVVTFFVLELGPILWWSVCLGLWCL